MEKKQKTAVEWLVEQLQAPCRGIPSHILEQAKAMEKEQHQESFNKGYDRRNYIHDLEYGGVEYWEEEPKEFEQYFTDTYQTEP